MKEQLGKRLKELKKEFEVGQKMLVDLDARRSNLGESLLRISGAIQVLEEELRKYNVNNVGVAGRPDSEPADVSTSGKGGN